MVKAWSKLPWGPPPNCQYKHKWWCLIICLADFGMCIINMTHMNLWHAPWYVHAEVTQTISQCWGRATTGSQHGYRTGAAVKSRKLQLNPLQSDVWDGDLGYMWTWAKNKPDWRTTWWAQRMPARRKWCEQSSIRVIMQKHTHAISYHKGLLGEGGKQ